MTANVETKVESENVTETAKKILKDIKKSYFKESLSKAIGISFMVLAGAEKVIQYISENVPGITDTDNNSTFGMYFSLGLGAAIYNFCSDIPFYRKRNELKLSKLVSQNPGLEKVVSEHDPSIFF